MEAMYSYEQLLSITGEAQWGDLAEALAFNALPATLSPDMWSHQYDQQTNQVCCTRLPEDHVVFATNPGDSHLFGLEPNFGCCTANFNQGWPKLALSTFMGWKEGLASVILAPSVVSCPDRGGPCHLPAGNGLPLPGHADLHRHHGQARALPLGHPHPRHP